jgi:predicted RNA-binding Zn-ribbon protein involved in translation (DUF1610 family)
MASVQDKQTQAETEAPMVRFPCSACGINLRVHAKSAGKKIKCPKCGKPTLVPVLESTAEDKPYLETAVASAPAPLRLRVMPILAVCGILAVVIGCSVYANLSFAVTDRVNFKYFPPFKPNANANMNRHLGAEYFNIARAMVAGKGFANPFHEDTGPTAWMPPILPTVLAGLLWACDNDIDAVMAVCLFMQGSVLIGTGFLVLALAWQTTARLGILAAAAFFACALVSDFHMWFQQTHDTSLVLLALDVVIAGFAWGRPLQGWKSAACWGLVGGTCAMISPIVALTWGVLSLALMIRERAWRSMAVAVVCAAVTLSPWIVRNYLVFGRLIPVKSNAAYELYQSQCRQKDGLLQDFNGHPYISSGPERKLYKTLGEMEFIDQKRAIFWQAVRADPLDFADRVACRFVGATLWYIPFTRDDETKRPWTVRISRALHPLPFLGFAFLAASATLRRLHAAQWVVMGAYALYLGPYIGVSYYERYAVPLLGVKVLLVIWAADRLLSLVWPPPTNYAAALAGDRESG